MCGPSQLPQADVQPHAVARNAGERLVEGRDVLLDDLDEFAVGFVLEEEHPLHRQVGRVDLQDQAGVDDGLVFVAHLAGDRVEISLVSLVIRVEHRGCDDPRRRLGEEHFGERRLDCVAMALEAGELGLDRFFVLIFELADRLGTAEDLSGFRKPRHEFLGKQRQSIHSRPKGRFNSPPKPDMRFGT